MKVCVINFSGNVGKSIVAGQLLQPRLQAPVISVESLNMDAGLDGVKVEEIPARQFELMQERLALMRHAIVDVGASNVEDFLRTLSRVAGAYEDFDLWIVPAMRSRKQQMDTVNTLRALHRMGVPASKVRVVFNGIETDESVHEVFGGLCALSGEFFELKERAVLYYNEVFDRIKGTGESLATVLADPRDIKAEILQSTDEEERLQLARRLATKRLATSANRNLDEAFAAITELRAA